MLRNKEGATTTAAKCFAGSPPRQASGGSTRFDASALTWLRKNSVPKDLERYWMGHAPEEVGDLYSKLKDDVAFRQEWAERAEGLALSWYTLVHKPQVQ